MKYIVTILIIALAIFSQSCFEEEFAPLEYGSTIFVKVKGGINDEPVRNIVNVDLKIYDENTNYLKTIITNTSNTEGEVVFKHISNGEYYVVPQKNESIGEVFASYVRVESNNEIDTVEAGVLYYWNFNRYSSIIEVDTTNNFIGMLTYFHNNGLRDTLYCQFDESNIPTWMSFSYSTNIFPPGATYSSNSYLIFGYDNDKIPLNQLPITVLIPIYHQYGTVNYKVIFRLKN